jgi:hypothetical protein
LIHCNRHENQPHPLGARFEYEGEIYTKTGPMTAASRKAASA